MRKNVISTCITAALILSSALAALPINAAIEADRVPLAVASDTADSAELLSFEELYSLEEDELKQYCSDHDLKYMSKERAEEWLDLRPGIWVNVKLNDYMLQGESDVLESKDLNAFNRKNYYDYDFEKMTSDLKLPEKYYKFDTEKNDFSYDYYTEYDADGKPEKNFKKYAAIYVEPDPSAANERSIVRLYQLIYVWTEQNPIVYRGVTMRFTKSPDSPDDTEGPDTLGDINSDGYINAVDASSVLSYYARISTDQEGGYNALQKLNADVNHDRLINAVDASSILSYYAYNSTSKDKISFKEYLLKN